MYRDSSPNTVMDKETPVGIDPPSVYVPTPVPSLADGPNLDPPLVDDSPLVTKGVCHRRGTTPRNLSTQKQSANMQTRWQLTNIVEKAVHRRHKDHITRDEIDVEELEYADDVVKTYASEVTRWLEDMIKYGNGSYAATKRLVDVGVLKESTGKLACAQCAKSTVCGLEDETMKKFRKFVSKDGLNVATKDLSDRFMDSRRINNSRRMNEVENKSKVDFTEDILGFSSDMYIQCKSKTDHRYPLTFHSIKEKKKSLTKGNSKKNIDRDENKMAIFLPFITGVGPGEMETILSMFGLPNSQYYERTTLRWQSVVCKNIIKVSNREMQYAMTEEIKATIIVEKD